MTQQTSPAATTPNQKSPAPRQPAPDRNTSAVRIRSRFQDMGKQETHRLERVVKSPITDPEHALISAMQMANIGAREAPAYALLFAETAFRPDRRPEGLQPGSLTGVYSDDFVERVTYSSLLIRSSIQGQLVKRVVASISAIGGLFGRPFRRQQMREMYVSEEQEAAEGEFD